MSLSQITPASPVADPVTEVAPNYLQNAWRVTCQVPPHLILISTFTLSSDSLNPYTSCCYFFHNDTASTLFSHLLCFLFSATFDRYLFTTLICPFSSGLQYDPISAHSLFKFGLCLPKNATHHEQISFLMRKLMPGSYEDIKEMPLYFRENICKLSPHFPGPGCP